MTEPFIRSQLVRFRHCDPAGIVYYPRYLEMVTEIVEDWFDEGLGLSFNDLHIGRGLAVPTVHLDCDFTSPGRLGETMTLTLNVRRIGRSSVTLDLVAACGEDQRFRAAVVLVLTTEGSGGALPWPDDLKGAMSRYAVAADTNGVSS